MFKLLIKIYYYNCKLSEYIMEYEYDDYVNILIEKCVDGLIVLCEYYLLDGEEGVCFLDLNGMIFKVKSEIFIFVILG